MGTRPFGQLFMKELNKEEWMGFRNTLLIYRRNTKRSLLSQLFQTAVLATKTNMSRRINRRVVQSLVNL